MKTIKNYSLKQKLKSRSKLRFELPFQIQLKCVSASQFGFRLVSKGSLMGSMEKLPTVEQLRGQVAEVKTVCVSIQRRHKLSTGTSLYAALKTTQNSAVWNSLCLGFNSMKISKACSIRYFIHELKFCKYRYECLRYLHELALRHIFYLFKLHGAGFFFFNESIFQIGRKVNKLNRSHCGPENFANIRQTPFIHGR